MLFNLYFHNCSYLPKYIQPTRVVPDTDLAGHLSAGYPRRPIILPDTVHPDFRLNSKYVNFFFKTLGNYQLSTKPTNISGRYFTLIFYTLKGSNKTCLFEVRIICSTVYPVIRPAGYLANETGYPAGYRIF